MNQTIWFRDHDEVSATPKQCASVNFKDYNKAQAAVDDVETVGDGRISPYVPWSYDAAIALAQGIDRVYNPGHYSDEPDRDASLLDPDPNNQPAWGDLLYETMGCQIQGILWRGCF